MRIYLRDGNEAVAVTVKESTRPVAYASSGCNHLLASAIARCKGKPAPSGIALTFIDATKGLDGNNKWGRYFRDIFINQAR